MPHLDSNIPSYIYYGSIGFGTLRFFKTTSGSKTYATLANKPLKRMQKQSSKQRFIISILKKTFGKNFKVSNVFAGTADSFIKTLSLHWARAVHTSFLIL